MSMDEILTPPEPCLTPISVDDVAWVGTGLVRPECVLATVSGDIYTADWRAGVAHIRPDGTQDFFRAGPVDGEVLKPNGIALLKDGSFLLAHLGAERGVQAPTQRPDASVFANRRWPRFAVQQLCC